MLELMVPHLRQESNTSHVKTTRTSCLSFDTMFCLILKLNSLSFLADHRKSKRPRKRKIEKEDVKTQEKQVKLAIEVRSYVESSSGKEFSICLYI